MPASGYRRPPRARAWGMAGAAVSLAGIALCLMAWPPVSGSERARQPRLTLFDVVRAAPAPPAADAPATRRAQPIPPRHRRQAPQPPARPAPAPDMAVPFIGAPAMPEMPLPVPARTPAGSAVPSAPAVADTVSRAGRAAYAALLWQRIAARRPAGLHLPGTALLIFTLDRTGDLVDLSIRQSSGSVLLDRVAARTVRRAAPFPPPPDGIGALTFSVSFHFD